MGNQLGAAQQPDYNNLPELQALAFVERLGGGRFLKTLKCAMSASGAGAGGAAGRSSEGGEAAWPAAGGSQLLVIKVYVKRDASERLSAYEEMLAEVRSRLSLEAAPNVMPFQWYRETQHVAYLARQYLHSTLLDRLATPPFLTRHEKLWFSFQLLQALAQCHGAGVVHGDIKGENVLVTSAGWVLVRRAGPGDGHRRCLGVGAPRTGG
jgi:phosphoinositide-3-kinase regulatory subunit 4